MAEDDENSRQPLIRRYGSNDAAEGDASDGPSGDHAHVTRKSSSRGTIANSVLVIIALAGLVALSVLFQSRSTDLQMLIKQDEEAIANLQSLVQSQAEVIERFNQSVTNSDVLGRLQKMQLQLNATTTDINEKLNSTKAEVDSKLSQTLVSLSETVKKAEAEINNEVDTVKKDFEQYVVTTQDQFSMENNFMVYQLAGTFTLLSCLISMWHMSAHLRKLNQPVIQRKILAILWMSPIYAITSWFSLVFHSAEGVLAIVKDAYEAYIIYQFLSFCIAVLGKGNREAVIGLLAKRADHLTPPFHLIPCCNSDYESDYSLARAVLLQCQTFAMQFVFLRPISTIATVLLSHYQYFGPWAESAADYRAPQPYIMVIQNFSVFLAFTGLLKFYHAVDEDLQWCRPFAKFLCIKGVVFMTFWQGVALNILSQMTDMGGNDSDEWAKAAQNFLICLEMLVFSIAHFYCFPTDEWEDSYRDKMEQQQRNAQLGDSIALGDFVSDLKLILRTTTRGSSKKKKKNKDKMKKNIPPTVEEVDDEDRADDTSDETNTPSEKTDEHADHGDGRDLESGYDSADSEDDDDDDSAVSDITTGTAYSIGSDTQRALSSAVVRNLSNVNNGELLEVREQLLNSSLFGSDLDPDEESQDAQPSSPPSVVETSTDDSPPAVNTSDTGDAGEKRPTERSGLLSGTAEMLRPSIFTSYEKKSGDE